MVMITQQSLKEKKVKGEKNKSCLKKTTGLSLLIQHKLSETLLEVNP